MREHCLNETGYDIATERKPPGWFPKGPLKCPAPSSGNPTCSPASTLDGLSSLRPPTVMPRFGEVPMMPAMPARAHIHREKIPRHGYCKWPACIARKVGVDERLANPKANKACEAEWDKLLNAGDIGCFDTIQVAELGHGSLVIEQALSGMMHATKPQA